MLSEMNPIVFLLFLVLAIDYLSLSRNHTTHNAFSLLLLSNILMFWLCQKNRITQACGLSNIIALLLLSTLLLYWTERNRMKLLIKIISVLILVNINDG